VVSVYTNREKLFAFVEFRTVEEAGAYTRPLFS